MPLQVTPGNFCNLKQTKTIPSPAKNVRGFLKMKADKDKEEEVLPVTSSPFQTPLQLSEHVQALIDLCNDGICMCARG